MTLPADVARCEGRAKTHAFYPECLQCRRMTAPPSDHPWQSWMRGWAGDGECPDKLEERREENKNRLITPRGSLGEEV